MNNCDICQREYPSESYKEKHHIVPNPYRSRTKYRKRKKETIPVCLDCADMVHQIFTNKELKDFLAEDIEKTLKNMLAHPKIQKWVEWVKDKEFGVCIKRKKRKK